MIKCHDSTYKNSVDNYYFSTWQYDCGDNYMLKYLILSECQSNVSVGVSPFTHFLPPYFTTFPHNSTPIFPLLLSGTHFFPSESIVRTNFLTMYIFQTITIYYFPHSGEMNEVNVRTFTELNEVNVRTLLSTNKCIKMTL